MSVLVVLVGCGNMGHAMLQGWLKADRLEAPEIAVVEPNDALRERAALLGVAAFSPTTSRRSWSFSRSSRR